MPAFGGHEPSTIRNLRNGGVGEGEAEMDAPARSVPRVHSRVHEDQRDGSGGGGHAALLPSDAACRSSHGAEAGGAGSTSPNSREGPFNQASGFTRGCSAS